MGGKSSSPPPAPDYVGAAKEQGAANKDSAIATAQLSNPNVYTPYGNQTVSYSVDPTTGNPVPTINQSLDPKSQQVYDQQQNVKLGLAGISQQALGTAQGVMNTPFSFGGPGVQTGVNNPSVTANANQNGSLNLSGVARMPVNAGTTGMDAIMSRLEPYQARQRTSLETQLTNQGLRPGGEAWDNGMKDFSNQQNDARIQAAAQGVNLDMAANNQGYNQALSSGQFGNAANLTNAQFANQASGQQFNQGLQSAQFGNTAQQQALAQAIQQRQMPLNEIAALMSGSQIQAPQFQNYAGAGATAAPIMAASQASAQGANNLYNAQMGAQNANTAGLYGLGGAAVGGAAMSAGTWMPYLAAMSDRRLKSNILRVGTHPLGIGIYEYDIFGRRETGVMADEVEKVKPEATGPMPNGYKGVRYDLL